MKKYLIFSFLVLFFMSAFSVDMSAQRRSKKKKKKTTTNRKSDYFDERGGSITDRLWYGADVNLNFGSFNGQSTFTIGLSPMVGYEITDNFSVGPRFSFLNTTQKVQNGLDDLTFNAFDIGGGIFARHKFLQQYFIHAEYSVISEEFPSLTNGFITVDSNNKIETERQQNAHYYLGLGYGGSAAGFGFTTYALWDFSQSFTSQNIPIEVRFGLTYNF